MSIALHDHQKVAIEKMRNGCVLYGGVGVGKTITSLAYYFTKVGGGELNKWGSMETPKDVYVITTAKVRDSQGFELQAAQMGVHQLPALSTNGVKITVDSWNNLHKYVEVKDAFFIFDEQRVVGYGAWAKAFIKISKSNEWILLSATPGDTWMDYIPVFIANGWYRNKTDFIDQHVIWTPRVKYPKVQRYQNVGKLVKYRNTVLVHMPYERHTIRHPVDIICDYDVELYDKVVKKRWHVYEERPLRDAAEMFSVAKRVVNSDSSRVETIRQLLQKHPRLIVFYNFDYELEILRELGASLLTEGSGLGSSTTCEERSVGSKTTRAYPSPRRTSSGRTTSTSSSTTETQTKQSETPMEKLPSVPQLPSPWKMSKRDEPQSTSTESRSASNRSDSLQEKSLNLNSASSPTVSGSGSRSSSSETMTTSSTSASTLSRTPWPTGPTASTALRDSATFPTATGSDPTASLADEEGPWENVPTQSQTGAAISNVAPAQRKNSKHSASSPGTVELNVGESDTFSSISTRETSPATATKSVDQSFAVAEWNGHKHEPIPTSDRWLYLVQYRAGAEGWNCIETDAMAFYSQTYSYRDWWQGHGRTDRLNTPFTDLWYYHLISKTPIDKGIRSALKSKKNFNEKNLILT